MADFHARWRQLQIEMNNSNGSTVKVFNSRFLREVTGFNLYAFNLENFLIALDDSPAEITIDGRNYSAQIVLSHGLKVEVGIEGYNSNFISEAILHTNKHVKPLKQGEFLLQGMIKCGACGYAFRSERNNGKRCCMCRGKMKSKHLDGSPRCKSLNRNAEWLENEVRGRISELLNDLNRLILVINDILPDASVEVSQES